MEFGYNILVSGEHRINRDGIHGDPDAEQHELFYKERLLPARYYSEPTRVRVESTSPCRKAFSVPRYKARSK